MLKNHPCKITICRSSGHREDMHIEIEDSVSGVRFFDGCMSLEDFTRAITAQACQPITAELWLENVGKKREHKHEIVYLPKDEYGLSEARKRELLKSFEMDGWIGYLGDLGNKHCRTGKPREDGARGYRVGFTRFV